MLSDWFVDDGGNEAGVDDCDTDNISDCTRLFNPSESFSSLLFVVDKAMKKKKARSLTFQIKFLSAKISQHAANTTKKKSKMRQRTIVHGC